MTVRGHHSTKLDAARGTLVITNWRDLRHPAAGGAEVVCEELAARFAASGLNVVLLTAASAPNPRVETRDGYTIVRRGSQMGVYPAALWWLLRHRRQLLGVIDSQNGLPFFTPLAVRPTTPVLLLFHHVHQDQFSRYVSPAAARLARFLEGTVTRWVYRRRAVVCVSPSTRRDVRVRLGLRGRAQVVPPGAPEPREVPWERRAANPRVVCVGRLVPHKRVTLVVWSMLDVLRKLPDAELHLVGDGPARVEIEQLVDELGLGSAVTVHGALPAAERDALMETAWLTASASEQEGWGLSVLEANAFGVPAVAFRRPGLRDSIRHGETGWLVEGEEAFASTIVAALAELADPAVAAARREATQAWVREFSWGAMADRFAAALSAEGQRLLYGRDDRRLETDLSSVAEVPRRLLPRGWMPRVRTNDQVRSSDGHLTLLLHGADTQSARLALDRIGLGPQLAQHPDIAVRVARPTDLLVLRSPAPEQTLRLDQIRVDEVRG